MYDVLLYWDLRSLRKRNFNLKSVCLFSDNSSKNDYVLTKLGRNVTHTIVMTLIGYNQVTSFKMTPNFARLKQKI
jgi:hypothetical protein